MVGPHTTSQQAAPLQVPPPQTACRQLPGAQRTVHPCRSTAPAYTWGQGAITGTHHTCTPSPPFHHGHRDHLSRAARPCSGRSARDLQGFPRGPSSKGFPRGPSSRSYWKASVIAKHYAAYSLETSTIPDPSNRGEGALRQPPRLQRHCLRSGTIDRTPLRLPSTTQKRGVSLFLRVARVRATRENELAATINAEQSTILFIK